MRDIDINSAIRQALAGSPSQQPVDAATLYKFGKKVDIDAQLGLMLANRELNSAQWTQGGVQKTLYWLTGVVSPFKSPWQLNQERLHTLRADLRTPGAEVRKNATEAQKTVTDVQKSATEVKPNTAKVVQTAAHQPEWKKEASMNTATTRVGIQPSEMNTFLYNKIVVHPGITQLALIKHAQHKFPDATEKQIKKMLCNLVHSAKKIRSEGKRGKLAYHLSIGVTQPPAKPASPAKPVQPVKRAAVGKVLHGEEGREAAKLAATSVAKASKPFATPVARVINDIKTSVETPVDDFSCLLQDDGSLCIVNGSGDVMLNPDQISRLQRFMTRYQIVQGAPV